MNYSHPLSKIIVSNDLSNMIHSFMLRQLLKILFIGFLLDDKCFLLWKRFAFSNHIMCFMSKNPNCMLLQIHCQHFKKAFAMSDANFRVHKLLFLKPRQ